MPIHGKFKTLKFYLISRTDVQIAIIVFAVQLCINVLWSLVFFGSHNIFGGLIMVMISWIAILINIFVFYRISRPAWPFTYTLFDLG